MVESPSAGRVPALTSSSQLVPLVYPSADEVRAVQPNFGQTKRFTVIIGL